MKKKIRWNWWCSRRPVTTSVKLGKKKKAKKIKENKKKKIYDPKKKLGNDERKKAKRRCRADDDGDETALCDAGSV